MKIGAASGATSNGRCWLVSLGVFAGNRGFSKERQGFSLDFPVNLGIGIQSINHILCLSICLFVRLSLRFSISPSISFYMLVCLSVCLPVYTC